MKKENKDFYAGIITTLAIVDLHGQDTIYSEIVEVCDIAELVHYAKEEGELEFSGLEKHGYTQPRWREP